MTYEAYIASKVWRRLRQLALGRDGYACRICSGTEQLEVHHRRYPPIAKWDEDRVENLTTLCSSCHAFATCHLRAIRYTLLKRPIAHDIVRKTPQISKGIRSGNAEDLKVKDRERITPANA